MLRVDLFSYFGIFLVCCGLYGPIPWWPQTMMASRYTMTATAMKTWKTNIGILLRNRQIYDIVGQISPSYVFVRRGLCPLWTSWSLWSSLLNPVCCLRSEDHGDGVRSKVDALSVNRLTLLGRIHMARVVVESLSLDGTSAVDVVPVRDRQRGRGARGKPPTPKQKVPGVHIVTHLRTRFCLDSGATVQCEPGFDNDGHKPWRPQEWPWRPQPWWPQTRMKFIRRRLMSLIVHLVLVFHVFIAVAIMVMVCGRHGIGTCEPL